MSLKPASPPEPEAVSRIPLYVPKTGGLSTTKVSVVRWLKREGEPVYKGEPLVELLTEKVTYVLDAPAGREKLLWMYTQMVRIRRFEEKVKQTLENHPGMIRGHTHLADGAEAAIVGALATLQPNDFVMSTYHCHGYPIALGTPTRQIMAEIYGKWNCRTGHSSSHGRRLAVQVKGTHQVVLCFFGDGATKQGAFHESLNIASLWKLPSVHLLVYILENNEYQAYTRVELEDANAAAGEDLSVKARAYSMPGVTVDGSDPIAVYQVVGQAVARARGARVLRWWKPKFTGSVHTGTPSRCPRFPPNSPSMRPSPFTTTRVSTRQAGEKTPYPDSGRSCSMQGSPLRRSWKASNRTPRVKCRRPWPSPWRSPIRPPRRP